MTNELQDFTAWELETIFHLASNAAHKASDPHFTKLGNIASKALNQQSAKFPDYNHGIKKVVAL